MGDTCKHCHRKLEPWEDVHAFICVSLGEALRYDQSSPATAETWRARVESVVAELDQRRKFICATCAAKRAA